MSASIELEGLTLDIPVFNVSRSFRSTLFNRFIGGKINKIEKSKHVSIRALEDINFKLDAGDRLGLIGHNGAGKTTLLRVLAKIYQPVIGRYKHQGKITPLFNMSLGLDLDDTGLDNIYTVGLHLGMSKAEIKSKKDEIIEFSELCDFIHLPVRIYSAGMQTRLSFAIATALAPEILLMDEGIGAGDANFAEKAQNRLSEFYTRTSIMVVASHSNDLIKKLCNKAMLLNHGRQVVFGSVDSVLSKYEEELKRG